LLENKFENKIKKISGVKSSGSYGVVFVGDYKKSNTD